MDIGQRGRVKGAEPRSILRGPLRHSVMRHFVQNQNKYPDETERNKSIFQFVVLLGNNNDGTVVSVSARASIMAVSLVYEYNLAGDATSGVLMLEIER